MENQNKIKWIYSSHNNQELTDRYDQWAKDYDSELEKSMTSRAKAYHTSYLVSTNKKGASLPLLFTR